MQLNQQGGGRIDIPLPDSGEQITIDSTGTFSSIGFSVLVAQISMKNADLIVGDYIEFQSSAGIDEPVDLSSFGYSELNLTIDIRPMSYRELSNVGFIEYTQLTDYIKNTLNDYKQIYSPITLGRLFINRTKITAFNEAIINENVYPIYVKVKNLYVSSSLSGKYYLSKNATIDDILVDAIFRIDELNKTLVKLKLKNENTIIYNSYRSTVDTFRLDSISYGDIKTTIEYIGLEEPVFD